MLSTFGIILTVLIIIALVVPAATGIIAKLGNNTAFDGKMSFLYPVKNTILKFPEAKQISYFISPIMLILFIIEILLIFPVIISGFYFQYFYFGIMIALFFNSFLIAGLIFLWKQDSLETLNGRIVINIIESVRNKFIKK